MPWALASATVMDTPCQQHGFRPQKGSDFCTALKVAENRNWPEIEPETMREEPKNVVTHIFKITKTCVCVCARLKIIFVSLSLSCVVVSVKRGISQILFSHDPKSTIKWQISLGSPIFEASHLNNHSPNLSSSIQILTKEETINITWHDLRKTCVSGASSSSAKFGTIYEDIHSYSQLPLPWFHPPGTPAPLSVNLTLNMTQIRQLMSVGFVCGTWVEVFLRCIPTYDIAPFQNDI